MRMKLIGHSCVWFGDESGRRIVTDPCRPGALGGRVWTAPVPPTDIVSVSHYHEDHGWLGAVPGSPDVMDTTGTSHGIDMEFTTTCHDHDGGCISGLNHMCRFTLDGITVLHPGDLGAIPDDQQLQCLSDVDLLLLPVGGTYTLPPADAVLFAERLGPKWVVPVHYRTPDVDLPMAPVDVFLKLWKGPVHTTESNRWTDEADTGLWLLKPPAVRPR
ncbi:MAG: MBL fold metallo-hydrolase [Myxococcota bacterium]|nr:MBL fold metallo-hydrolase [Myxococcota bacterium]